MAIEQDLTGIDIVKSWNQIGERCLSGAGRSYKGYQLPGFGFERDSGDGGRLGALLIAKFDVLKLHASHDRARRHRDGVWRFFYVARKIHVFENSLEEGEGAHDFDLGAEQSGHGEEQSNLQAAEGDQFSDCDRGVALLDEQPTGEPVDQGWCELGDQSDQTEEEVLNDAGFDLPSGKLLVFFAVFVRERVESSAGFGEQNSRDGERLLGHRVKFGRLLLGSFPHVTGVFTNRFSDEQEERNHRNRKNR